MLGCAAVHRSRMWMIKRSLVALLVAVGLVSCGHQAGPVAPTTPTTPAPAPDPLRAAAAAAGKLVGAAVQSSFLTDPHYTAVLARHFDYLTAEYEMKWDPI